MTKLASEHFKRHEKELYGNTQDKGKRGYRVIWVIDVDATDVREAAKLAMEMAQKPTDATIYDVVEGKTVFSVDTADEDDPVSTRPIKDYAADTVVDPHKTEVK